MASPVPTGTPVSFAYKRRYANGKPHKGVDFGCKKGTKVFAAISGRVWYAGDGGGWGGAYGAQVIIRGDVDGDIRYVQVAHLSRLDVKTGQSVMVGQQVGLSGGVPGQWGAGNTTGAHVHFQVNKSTLWSDHVDPWPAINDEPTAAIGPRIAKVSLTNHAAATAALAKVGAKAKWYRRRARLVNINVGSDGIHPDVLGGLECGAGATFDYLNTKYRKHGYALVPDGTEGRNFWADTETTTIGLSGVIRMPQALRYQDDDKPAPWFIGTTDGVAMLYVLFHLEPKNFSKKGTRPDSDDFRVGQANHIIDQAEAIATANSLDKTRIVFLGDSASENWVRQKAFVRRGYGDALDIAAKAVNAAVKSYNRWKPPVFGPRVDIIATYVGKGPGKGKDRARPVSVAALRLDHVATDHHVYAAVINRQQ